MAWKISVLTLSLKKIVFKVEANLKYYELHSYGENLVKMLQNSEKLTYIANYIVMHF